MKTNHTGGFNLVEIIIVVVILSLFVAVSIPNFIMARRESEHQKVTRTLEQTPPANNRLIVTNVVPYEPHDARNFANALDALQQAKSNYPNRKIMLIFTDDGKLEGRGFSVWVIPNTDAEHVSAELK